MASDEQNDPVDPVAPDGRPEVPTPDTGREVLMPNRHQGIAPERPGTHDDDAGPASTPEAPGPHPDPDPDPTEPPDVLPDPDPQDPSVAS